MFSIEWLANPQTPAPLTNSRAAAIESALRANPALPPERLSFAHAPGQLKACPDRPAPETLLLQLDWAGRWYGGE